MCPILSGPSPALQFVLVEAEEVAELVNEGLAYLAAQFHLRPGQRLQRALKERDPVGLHQHGVGEAFYERDAANVPRRWIATVKEAIRTVAPRFSARRMVREYAEKMYAPALAGKLELKTEK